MRRSLVLLLLVSFLSPILSAQEDTKAAESNTKASGRIEAAGTVLDEIEAAPDQRIPEEVLGSAECVAVVPSLETVNSSSLTTWPFFFSINLTV